MDWVIEPDEPLQASSEKPHRRTFPKCELPEKVTSLVMHVISFTQGSWNEIVILDKAYQNTKTSQLQAGIRPRHDQTTTPCLPPSPPPGIVKIDSTAGLGVNHSSLCIPTVHLSLFTRREYACVLVCACE